MHNITLNPSHTHWEIEVETHTGEPLATYTYTAPAPALPLNFIGILAERRDIELTLTMSPTGNALTIHTNQENLTHIKNALAIYYPEAR